MKDVNNANDYPLLKALAKLPWPSHHKVADGDVAPENSFLHVVNANQDQETNYQDGS